MSLRDLLERFGLKIVQLFKLLLLEKKVLFFHSPVRPLSTSIVALLALFPGLVENGLDTCTSFGIQDSIVNESLEIPTQIDQASLDTGRAIFELDMYGSINITFIYFRKYR